MLDAIKEQQDRGTTLKREHFVAPAKYLNRISGITLLDCLSRNDVRQMIRAYFETEEFANYKA